MSRQDKLYEDAIAGFIHMRRTAPRIQRELEDLRAYERLP